MALAALAWDADTGQLCGRVDGEIAALHASDGEVWAATTRGVFHSADGAASWYVLHQSAD